MPKRPRRSDCDRDEHSVHHAGCICSGDSGRDGRRRPRQTEARMEAPTAEQAKGALRRGWLSALQSTCRSGGSSGLSCRGRRRRPDRVGRHQRHLECTGRFRSRSNAAKHLEAGARKVIVSAPMKDADATIVLGVNFETYSESEHDVISNASCTTELSRACGESAPRRRRHPTWLDDDDPRLHGGSATGRPAAQGPPPGTRSGDEPHSDVDRGPQPALAR